MLRSALKVLFSLSVFAIAVPAVHAEDGAAEAPVVHKHKSKKSKHVHHKKAASAAEHDAPAIAPHERLVKHVVISHGRRHVVYRRVAYTPTIPAVPPVLSAGELAGLHATHDPLALQSNVALVMDQDTSEVLFEKNANVALPIASITKLMTALVVMDAHQDMNEVLEVTADDIDRLKHSSSRLQVGSRLTRTDMLHIALMSSENRAASALGRNYPGGLPAFVEAMNTKAKALGMTEAHYADSTGLSSQNVASARDLAKVVKAAYEYPLLRQYSTDQEYTVHTGGRHTLEYHNTNHLVSSPTWEIGLQKTGYITEAGRCMVMQAKIEGRPVVMVFLDGKGVTSRVADAGRVRKWLENVKLQKTTVTEPLAAQS